MSLKTYKYPEEQDFSKLGSGDLLAGLQKSKTFALLDIYNAYSDNRTITYVKAKKLDANGNEIEEKTLSTNLIKYENGQYLIDKNYNVDLSEGIYFLEFANGYDIFKTEPFLVEKMNIRLTADLTAITVDNTIIKINDTHIKI